MAESFRWRGDDVTQHRLPGKAARLTGQSAVACHPAAQQGRRLGCGKSAGDNGSIALMPAAFRLTGLSA